VGPKFLISAFDYDLRRETFFRSDTASLASTDVHKRAPTVAEAIHASTNAPINYFDQPATLPVSPSFSPHRYSDGAIGGYNNPVLAAVTEALANAVRYGVGPDSLIALSLGTGNTALPLLEPDGPTTLSASLVVQQKPPGLVGDIGELAKSIVSDPPDAATYTAHLVLGGRGCCDPDASVTGPVTRLNPMIQPQLVGRAWTLPPGLNQAQFARLVALDMDAMAQADVELIDTFCTAWTLGAVANQAIRSTSEFQPLIGHDRYRAAMTEARNRFLTVQVPRAAAMLTGSHVNGPR